MHAIRIDASTATILLTEAPAPKARDRQTGETAEDDASGEALMTVGVVCIDEGESSLMQVTVTESVARPWESVFNGQQRHGVAHRATPLLPGPS